MKHTLFEAPSPISNNKNKLDSADSGYFCLLKIPPYLLEWQEHKLFCLGHFHKVLQHILVRRLKQVTAGVCISKAPNTQAVGGVQLAEKELTAGIAHPVELQQACSWEQRLGRERFHKQKSITNCLSFLSKHNYRNI